jgi:hypothetical protein
VHVAVAVGASEATVVSASGVVASQSKFANFASVTTIDLSVVLPVFVTVIV